MDEGQDLEDWPAGFACPPELHARDWDFSENMVEYRSGSALEARKGSDTPSAPLSLLDIAAWDGMPTPVRHWVLHNLIPVGETTLFSGVGGVGKSLLSQQLATCVAAGRPFLGQETRQGGALFLTYEDGEDELHRRQKDIAASLGLSLSKLSKALGIASLKGAIGAELARFDATGRLIIGDTWRSIEATADALKASLIILDNASHAMIGDHNKVEQVAPFLGMLEGLALSRGGALVLLHHTNKQGDDWLGSVSYENQVRSRLILKRDDNDRDVRHLHNPKSNYSAGGNVLQCRWHKGAFVRDEDLPTSTVADLAATARATAENKAFLDCLDARTGQGEGRGVGPSTGPNYAPVQFEGMAEARGYKRDALRRAMERLFAIGALETYQHKVPGKGRSVTLIRALPNATA